VCRDAKQFGIAAHRAPPAGTINQHPISCTMTAVNDGFSLSANVAQATSSALLLR